MAGQGRPPGVALCVALLTGSLVTVASAADRIPDTMRADAQLNAVSFVDIEHGWAVGDRGAIWHTDDGGDHWRLQRSGVECRLEAVQFLDARNGWAAGGTTQPQTLASNGVFLHTRDGGEHWTVDQKVLLPAVTRLGFFNAQHGWAIGTPTAMFPSGVFTTEDGGRSWAALPAAAGEHWLAADFLDPFTGALAGRNGAIGTVRRKGIVSSPNSESGLRSFRRLKFASPELAWLVGDGGLVFQSTDHGHTWQTPVGALPDRIDRHFDFSALAVRGSNCWIAGSPGTRVMHSADGGRSWSAHSTGQSLPIRDLVFLDERHGWAVGDLGAILATQDGGRSWRRVHSGGGRAALLGIFCDAEETPLELLAKLSADDGYLGVIEILNRHNIAAASTSIALDTRVHDAVVLAGACAAESAWRFPLRPAELKLNTEQLIAGWDRANDGQGLARLESHLVAKIRQWRPEVVFTSSAQGAADSRSTLLNQLVLRAVDQAADPQAHRELASEVGLLPWKVQKVYGALPPGELGTANITTSQLATRLGGSLADLAAPARGLLTTEYKPAASTLGFRLLVNHIPQELGERDFFSGIALQPGGDARRQLNQVSDQSVETLKRTAQTRRNLQAILDQSEAKDGGAPGWLGQVSDLTRSLRDDQAAEVLHQLAQRYHRTGRWELAADGFDLLNLRYPKHPLGDAALVWLVQYYSSGEAEWRAGRGQQFVMQNFQGSETRPQDIVPAGGITAAGQVRRAGGLIQDRSGVDNRFVKAANYAHQLEQRQPGLFSEPRLRFPLAASDRYQGLPRQADRYFMGMRRTRQHDAWWHCAQGEYWLGEPQGECPKAIWRCPKTPAKPYLDGRLDEPLWRHVQPIELRSPQRDDADWPAVVLLAYDSEYLYLAVSCSRAPGVSYSNNSANAPRPRDGDLSTQDRIEVEIDLDRDYTTSYRLAVDHRGWTSDSCWGDGSWNPSWCIAAQQGDHEWTAEAAIPITELTGKRPDTKHVWAIGARRLAPGVGLQSWPITAGVELAPARFGYLIFD